jgi:hypothetical protein
MDVLPARGAFGVRPRVGGGVDREPQPAPPGTRLPHRRGILARQPGQRGLQQPVIDHVVPADPGTFLLAVGQQRQRPGQQRGERFLIDPAAGQRVVQGAVPAGELRLQRQLHQRGHGVIGAQDRVNQLELRVRSRGQAGIQLRAELLQRQEPVNGTGDLSRIKGRWHHGRARRDQRAARLCQPQAA